MSCMRPNLAYMISKLSMYTSNLSVKTLEKYYHALVLKVHQWI